jgi:hypothetical protein
MLSPFFLATHANPPEDFDSDANLLGVTTNIARCIWWIVLSSEDTSAGLWKASLCPPASPVQNVASHCSQSRNGRRIVSKSCDNGLSFAMESYLLLHTRYSLCGSRSDCARSAHVSFPPILEAGSRDVYLRFPLQILLFFGIAPPRSTLYIWDSGMRNLCQVTSRLWPEICHT